MTDKARKVSAGVLLTMGTSVNFTAVLGLAYAMGQKSQKLDEVASLTAANTAMIQSTRERIDDRMDELIKAVSRIEGRLGRRQ